MKKDFLPAAHYHFLTPLYDAFTRFFLRNVFRKITEIIRPTTSMRILDLGCGPGNLIIALKNSAPEAEIQGLDLDPEMLEIARRKLARAEVQAKLTEASATEIPFESSQFDVVVSTLMIHHLSHEDRQKMIREAHRVLKPGGKFYLYDFGRPKGALAHFFAKAVGLFEDVSDGVSGNYSLFLKEAGFKNIQTRHRSMLFELLHGQK